MYLTKTTGNLNPRGQQPQSNLQVSTVRSFEGGLNVTDTDLNMSPKFAKTLDNFERGTDGSQSLRPGTKLLTDNIADTSDIVNHTYFAGLIWSVQTSGNITTTDGGHCGAVVVKYAWPAGVTYVDFTVFNSNLIIVNGKDKPLIVAGRPSDPNYLIVQFLVDLASLSNVNTPIGKYVIAHGRYTIIAGVATDPSSIFVSMQDTSGTWFGDPSPMMQSCLTWAHVCRWVMRQSQAWWHIVTSSSSPSSAVYCLSTSECIQGRLLSIHQQTMVSLKSMAVLLTAPSYQLGTIPFSTITWASTRLQRINLFNTLRPQRLSQLIDPLITGLIQGLTNAQIQQYVFAVYDLRHFRYMIFIPVFDGGVIQETICFSYTNIPTLKIQAWARLRGWIWQSACRTALQNIVFSRGNKLYAYDYDNPTIGADRLNDPDVNAGSGEPISFEWEFPWADFKHRMDIKYIKYISFDTEGQAPFTCEAYVDNLIEQRGTRMPMLSMEFVGGDLGGYGDSPYGDAPYGGGRRTIDERTFGYNTKFKLLKLRLIGATKHKLRIVSVSLAYLHGAIRR